MEFKPNIKSYEKLRNTAKEIIDQAERDLTIWSAILKETQCQIEIISKANAKSKN